MAYNSRGRNLCPELQIAFTQKMLPVANPAAPASPSKLLLLGQQRAASLQDEVHTRASLSGFNHRFLFSSSKKMKAVIVLPPAVLLPWAILG